MSDLSDIKSRRLIRYVAAVSFLLIATIAATWHLGGWSEDNYWPYFMVWMLSAITFAVSGIIEVMRTRTALAESLLITGGVLCFPLGIPATIVGIYFLSKRQRQQRNVGVFVSVALFLGMSCSVALFSSRLKARPFDPQGLLRGAPLSWCHPGNMASLVTGVEYGNLRHLALICAHVEVAYSGDRQSLLGAKPTVVTRGPPQRVSFAHLGYTREHMREVNAILRRHLGSNYDPMRDSERTQFKQAQAAAMEYLIYRQNRTRLGATGLIPALAVDDAVTTGKILRNSAGLLVTLALQIRDYGQSTSSDIFSN